MKYFPSPLQVIILVLGIIVFIAFMTMMPTFLFLSIFFLALFVLLTTAYSATRYVYGDNKEEWDDETRVQYRREYVGSYISLALSILFLILLILSR